MDRATLDLRTHARFIIRRVMERGTREQVRAVRSFYPPETVRDALVTARSLDPKTISYFSAVMDIPLNEFRAVREPARNWEPAW